MNAVYQKVESLSGGRQQSPRSEAMKRAGRPRSHAAGVVIGLIWGGISVCCWFLSLSGLSVTSHRSHLGSKGPLADLIGRSPVNRLAQQNGLPGARRGRPRPRVDNAMVIALARAFRWRNMLDPGVHAVLEDLARANPVASYVSRVLRLTLHAPEIVEAILDGRQPAELQLDDLLDGAPLEWKWQRRSLANNDSLTSAA